MKVRTIFNITVILVWVWIITEAIFKLTIKYPIFKYSGWVFVVVMGIEWYFLKKEEKQDGLKQEQPDS